MEIPGRRPRQRSWPVPRLEPDVCREWPEGWRPVAGEKGGTREAKGQLWTGL